MADEPQPSKRKVVGFRVECADLLTQSGAFGIGALAIANPEEADPSLSEHSSTVCRLSVIDSLI